MAEMIIEQYQVGMIGTNCYFLINKETKEVLVVDPGGHAGNLADKVKAEGLKPVAILLTHGHSDHAMGAEELKGLLQVPVIALKEEQETLEDPRLNLSPMFGVTEKYSADQYVRDGEVLHLAGFDVKVLHTPGHTVGGCCYYFEEQKIVVSGDTLFCGSVGRTDFPKGSGGTLVRSIKNKLMVLPDDVQVLPGHDSRTTIGWERVNNPFL